MTSNFDPQKHHRRSIRLKGYDYTLPGAYFVTIVTHGRDCIFGEIVQGEMHPNKLGSIIQAAWQDLPIHYYHVRLDEFVVMPNHVHGIFVLIDDIGTDGSPDPPLQQQPARHGLPEIIRAFKSFSARRINQILKNEGAPVWQRNYYERIIRNNTEWERIRLYIQNNPIQWENDQINPRQKIA